MVIYDDISISRIHFGRRASYHDLYLVPIYHHLISTRTNISLAVLLFLNYSPIVLDRDSLLMHIPYDVPAALSAFKASDRYQKEIATKTHDYPYPIDMFLPQCSMYIMSLGGYLPMSFAITTVHITKRHICSTSKPIPCMTRVSASPKTVSVDLFQIVDTQRNAGF